MNLNELMNIMNPNDEYVILTLKFREDRYPFLTEISTLLYDLALVNDLSAILAFEEYDNYQFSRYFYFRNHKRVSDNHKLRTASISKHSPLLIEIIGAVGAIWAFVQLIEKVGNWKLNKKKLDLEIQKLGRELALTDVQILEKINELEQRIRGRQAGEVFRQLVRRLERAPIVLEDVEIRKAPYDDDT